MNMVKKRLEVYLALAVLCGLTAALVGPGAGLWTFVQIVAVVELIYWTGRRHRRAPAQHF